MPYDLQNRLVVGVASSALFDLTESDAYFNEHGEEPYRIYQHEHIDDQLQPGVAFPFIKRLLGLNDLREASDPLVEVIVLSKNDPSTGLRVMRSIEAHGLAITRAIFTQGRSPYEYIEALSMSLFLSANEADVKGALERGLPAGMVMASASVDEEDGGALRIAFDFDGVIADDGSERVFQGPGGLGAFQAHEVANSGVPLSPGPLREFLRDLNLIQRIEQARRDKDASYELRLRISIVTARNAPAHERAIQTLQDWGVTVNDAFFLGGIDKGTILRVMKPHIFFDDQKNHLDSTSAYAASVHIPYGIANEARRVPEPELSDVAATVDA
ncbi:5'-nucleotidase [Glaciibacter psychrotolerans]|uniref:5'-nucleotidase n=1 Tax=Glaciibacter psychrotolerans TaxID=670054 RepID=A0A7Z0EBQ6_9MICO|nr:5'-nucleotidase [Leifsonia psychrotolerans]NYJ18717.1 5'-nucleotidase [Leifsonia psychrotolerans]